MTSTDQPNATTLAAIAESYQLAEIHQTLACTGDKCETSTEQIYRDHDPFVQIDALIALVDQAAPIMMKLAYDGGSMFAKDWLDRAKEFNIDALEEDEVQADGP